MSPRPPPRYLPTLTEVVRPHSTSSVGVDAVAESLAPAATRAPNPAAALADPARVASAPVAEPFTPSPDRQALAQQLVSLVRPQLEAELRALAQQHFDAQFSAWLPRLQQHIEAAVRDALDHSPPEPQQQRHDGR